MKTSSRAGLRPPTRPAWHGPPDVLRLVWSRPRASVRWLIDHGGIRLSILLVCGAAATTVVADGSLLVRTSEFGRWTWLVELSVGMILWLLVWAVAALALTGVGRVLSGVGTFPEVLIALAWGQAPAAAGLSFALLKLWSHSVDSPGSELLCAIVLFVLYAWAVVTTTLAVAEAHRVSLLRSVICVLAALGLYVAVGATLNAVYGLNLGV
jgi:hypothetical protein